jgi:hypothetical protein
METVLSRDKGLQTRFGLVIGFIGHLNTPLMAKLYKPLSHRLAFSVTVFTSSCFIAAFDSGRSPFLWVPVLSPISPTIFSQLQLSTHCLVIKVEVTSRLTVSQSVSLYVEPHLGIMTRYLLLFDSYGLVFVGRLL